MKTIGVVVILMLVMAGVAVGGSRAQALPATSTAFAQCQEGTGSDSAACRPLVTPVAMFADEGAGTNNDYGDYGAVGANEVGADVSPEHDFGQHLLAAAVYGVEALLEAFARELHQHFFGRGTPMTLDFPVASSLFDPAR